MAASTTLRSLLHELRVTSPNNCIKNSGAAKYITSQFRKYETTDEQLCKVKDEMSFLAKTYLCYLQSSRKHREINADYKGAGEKTVEQTATMVGFKLPHDPK